MQSFNLEESFLLGVSHLESLVDDQGRTYFDIFLTDPAEAVTDWPDFVDLPARYLEAAMMAEPIVGRLAQTVPALRQRIFSFIKADGLAYRPDSPISHPIAELFDQSRLLISLVSAVMYDPGDTHYRRALLGLLNGLRNLATFQEDYGFIKEIGVYFGGTLIRPLVQAGLVLQQSQWIDLAGKFAYGIMNHSANFAADGSFHGHVHAHLATLAGIYAYSVLRDDGALRQKVIQAFHWWQPFCTDFGFVPELAQRRDDLIACETCTLMDYLDLAILLARYESPSYWNWVEKAVRNHLVESQIRSADWLATHPQVRDEDGIIRTQIRQRVLGSFAGWSAPHGLLAYHEELGPNWTRSADMKPRYLKKIRAVQNCCAGGGIRALHQAFSNIVLYENRRLDIPMLIDRQTPQVHIRSFIPFQGRALIELRQDCQLRFRPGQDADPRQVKVNRNLNGRTEVITAVWQDGFVDLGSQTAGSVFEITLPLAVRREMITIGNPGYQKYQFEVTWKGDTVIAVQADPANPDMGYTELNQEYVKLFYGPNAIGPIYQRQHWLGDCPKVAPAKTVEVSDAIDWYRLIR